MLGRAVRLELAFILVLFGTSAIFGQTAPIAGDARLQKPISLRLKIVSISKALVDIAKLTGVRLDRSPTVKDLKVTILVKDQPAGVVLDSIAKTLCCEWHADGSLYRLGMNPTEQAGMSRFVDAEEAAAQTEITDEVQLVASLSHVNPTEARKTLLEMADAKTDPKNSKITYDPEQYAFLQRAINRQDVMLGRLLVSLSADKVASFWRGEMIAAPTNIVGQKLSDTDPALERAAPIRHNKGFSAGTSPDAMPQFLQFDPYLYRVQVFQGFGVRYVARRLGELLLEPFPTGKLQKLAFAKSISEWDQPIPLGATWADSAVGSTKTASGYANGRYSLADFLEKAFDQTGQSFVADAFRVPAVSKDLNSHLGSLGTWLGFLKVDNHLTTHFESDIAMVRHAGFWRLRKFETPEEEFSELESKAAKGELSLSDYSAFVGKLSAEHAKPLTMKDWVLAKFDCSPIEEGLPALRFYGSLDQRQIGRATEDGIAYSELSTAQRLSYLNAAEEGIFYSAVAPAFIDDLYRFVARGDSRGLGFIMRTENKKVSEHTVAGQDLVFGLNGTQATIYRLAVSH